MSRSDVRIKFLVNEGSLNMFLESGYAGANRNPLHHQIS